MLKGIFAALISMVFIFGAARLSFAQHEHPGHEQGTEAAAASPAAGEAVIVGNKTCPVSAEKIDEKLKVTYEYQGKIYNFCCTACIDEFKKDPEKYIKKAEEEKMQEKTKQKGLSGESQPHSH